MKKSLIFLLLVLPLAFGFSGLKNDKTTACTCSAPSNVELTFQDSGSISFDWDDCGCFGFTEFKVKYTRAEDHYSSPEYSTGSSNYSFSNLPSGTYDFYFKTVCGSEGSSFIVIEDQIMG